MTDSGRPTLRSLLGLSALVGVTWGLSQLLNHWQDARAAAAIREHSQRVDITLYTTSSCPYCAQAIAWLTQHGVRWRACNIETDAACQRTYVQQGSPGVPLVRAGERWHLGFHAPWLAEALSAQIDQIKPGNAASAPDQTARQSTGPVSRTQADSPSGASSPRP